jgi:hypothetical protein
LLGGFTWELVAFKAEFNAFGVGAVADLAELVFPCNAADISVWACAFLHFGGHFSHAIPQTPILMSIPSLPVKESYSPLI